MLIHLRTGNFQMLLLTSRVTTKKRKKQKLPFSQLFQTVIRFSSRMCPAAVVGSWNPPTRPNRDQESNLTLPDAASTFLKTHTHTHNQRHTLPKAQLQQRKKEAAEPNWDV